MDSSFAKTRRDGNPCESSRTISCQIQGREVYESQISSDCKWGLGLHDVQLSKLSVHRSQVTIHGLIQERRCTPVDLIASSDACSSFFSRWDCQSCLQWKVSRYIRRMYYTTKCLKKVYGKGEGRLTNHRLTEHLLHQDNRPVHQAIMTALATGDIWIKFGETPFTHWAWYPNFWLFSKIKLSIHEKTHKDRWCSGRDEEIKKERGFSGAFKQYICSKINLEAGSSYVEKVWVKCPFGQTYIYLCASSFNKYEIGSLDLPIYIALQAISFISPNEVD